MSTNMTTAKESWAQKCEGNEFLLALCGKDKDLCKNAVSYLTEGLADDLSGVDVKDQDLSAELCVTRVGDRAWEVSMCLTNPLEALAKSKKDHSRLQVKDTHRQIAFIDEMGSDQPDVNTKCYASQLHVGLSYAKSRGHTAPQNIQYDPLFFGEITLPSSLGQKQQASSAALAAGGESAGASKPDVPISLVPHSEEVASGDEISETRSSHGHDESEQDFDGDVDMAEGSPEGGNQSGPRLSVKYWVEGRKFKKKNLPAYQLNPKRVTMHASDEKPKHDSSSSELITDNFLEDATPLHTQLFDSITIAPGDTIDQVTESVNSCRKTYTYQHALRDLTDVWRRRSEAIYNQSANQAWSHATESLAKSLSELNARDTLTLDLAQTHHKAPQLLNNQTFLYVWWRLKDAEGNEVAASTDNTEPAEPAWIPRGY